MQKMVTLAKGGSKERTVNIDKINIPDMWHLASWLKNGTNKLTKKQREEQAEMLLETWHLVHNLKRHITESEENTIDELQARATKAIGFAEAIGAHEITAALLGEI